MLGMARAGQRADRPARSHRLDLARAVDLAHPRGEQHRLRPLPGRAALPVRHPRHAGLLRRPGAQLRLPALLLPGAVPAGRALGPAREVLALPHHARTREVCNDCDVCGADCQGAAEPQGTVRATECMVCLNCIEACPRGGIAYGFLPAPELPRPTGSTSARRRWITRRRGRRGRGAAPARLRRRRAAARTRAASARPARSTSPTSSPLHQVRRVHEGLPHRRPAAGARTRPASRGCGRRCWCRASATASTTAPCAARSAPPAPSASSPLAEKLGDAARAASRCASARPSSTRAAACPGPTTPSASSARRSARPRPRRSTSSSRRSRTRDGQQKHAQAPLRGPRPVHRLRHLRDPLPGLRPRRRSASPPSARAAARRTASCSPAGRFDRKYRWALGFWTFARWPFYIRRGLCPFRRTGDANRANPPNPQGETMKRILAVTTVLLLAGCGLKDKGDEFRNGFPKANDVKVNVPAKGQALSGSGPAPGRPARRDRHLLPVHPRHHRHLQHRHRVRARAGQGHLRQPPDLGHRQRRRVGAAHRGALAQHLQVHRHQERRPRLQLRPRGQGQERGGHGLQGDPLGLAQGRGGPAGLETEGFGNGTFMLDWDKAKLLPEHGPEVGTATFTYSRLDAAANTKIDIDFHQVKDDDTGKLVNAAYKYDSTPAAGRRLRVPDGQGPGQRRGGQDRHREPGDQEPLAADRRRPLRREGHRRRPGRRPPTPPSAGT